VIATNREATATSLTRGFALSRGCDKLHTCEVQPHSGTSGQVATDKGQGAGWTRVARSWIAPRKVTLGSDV
jgi:hypothetical protein